MLLSVVGLVACEENSAGTSGEVSLGGCKEIEKHETLYSLQEAYDLGFLSTEDLRSIAYYFHNGLEWVEVGFTLGWNEPGFDGYDSFAISNKDGSLARISYGSLELTDFVPIPKTPEALSAEMENAIKQTWADEMCLMGATSAKAENTTILGYYGTYNDFIIVGIAQSVWWGYLAWETIDEVVFSYTSVNSGSIRAWKQN